MIKKIYGHKRGEVSGELRLLHNKEHGDLDRGGNDDMHLGGGDFL
jgi:hypothetical protein